MSEFGSCCFFLWCCYLNIAYLHRDNTPRTSKHTHQYYNFTSNHNGTRSNMKIYKRIRTSVSDIHWISNTIHLLHARHSFNVQTLIAQFTVGRTKVFSKATSLCHRKCTLYQLIENKSSIGFTGFHNDKERKRDLMINMYWRRQWNLCVCVHTMQHKLTMHTRLGIY